MIKNVKTTVDYVGELNVEGEKWIRFNDLQKTEDSAREVVKNTIRDLKIDYRIVEIITEERILPNP